jgi:hypothetical protein
MRILGAFVLVSISPPIIDFIWDGLRWQRYKKQKLCHEIQDLRIFLVS